MAERKVTVVVDLKSTGNLAETLKGAHTSIGQLKNILAQSQASNVTAQNPVFRAQQMRFAQVGFQAQASQAQRVTQDAITSRGVIGGPDHMAALRAEVEASKELATNKRLEARAMNVAQYGALGATVKEFGGGLADAKWKLLALNATMAGFVAAASPAAFQTLAGSAQLAAGEIGVMLIPAVVSVSNIMQNVASVIKTANDVTFGFVGKILGAAAVVGTFGFVFSAVAAGLKPLITFGTYLYGLSGAANAAAAGLTRVAVAGGVSGIGGAIPSAAGAAGGMSALGRVGLGAAGMVVGGAIGGPVGGAISGASLGATIGSFIAPGIGTAIGGAIGAVGGLAVSALSATTEKTLSKISMNFQAGAVDIGDMHDVLQREAMRDPMQQAQFDQQTRAIEALAREVGILSGNVARTNQVWQVNQ